MGPGPDRMASGPLLSDLGGRMEKHGGLTRGMHFGHFANKGDGVPLHPPPPQIAY